MDVVPFGPWGNEQSRNFSFRFFEGQILKGFKIRHGNAVDGITFILGDKSSNQVTSEQTVGGQGGRSEEVEFDITAGEFITEIQGKSAEYVHHNGLRSITSMTIFTNLKEEGYGPYGLGSTAGEDFAKNMSPFSSPRLSINGIVGFLGGANQYLESIGIFVNMAPQKLGPWGNGNSQNWGFQFENRSLRGIRIRHGYVVDAIAFGMADPNSVSWENSYGGEGGSMSEIQLNPAVREYITQISGTVANYAYSNNLRCITSLIIHTNLNPTGYGPYGLGRKEGEYGAKNLSPFSSPLISNNAVVGFHGRASQYLESIGLFAIPIATRTPR